MIYLDNSMAARPSKKGISAMMPYFTDYWASPSSPHAMGQQTTGMIRDAYQSLYDFLGAGKSDAVVFTSCGAESANHVFHSIYTDIALPRGKNHFITGKTSEAPALMAMHQLEELGCVGKCVDVDRQGQVTKELLGDVLSPRAALVSLSWGDGLTGVIQPVEEIAALCEERGILLHLDATHVLGKRYFTLEEVKADLISFNGSQIHAPQGTGALYIRHGLKISPFIAGGMEQAGLRGGDLNVPGLAALSVAAKEALDARDLVCTETARLRDRLEENVASQLEDVTIFYQDQERLPHLSCMGFPGVANEALLFLLNKKGVMACIGGGSFQQIGLVLMAAGVEETLAHSSMSFSLSRETTESEIDRASEMIVEAVKQLRKSSMGINL
ncbi:cysteine desulfurase [Waddlia chondrophila 2032/99]|uniref:Cysteine desulfurase n=2 Tax=Waddlia chondrophila TaxID=71667 RepID=F8LAL1_9BACT|nr:cysteine desulfurase family protein [Waddlia chondrophila]ADI37673.1 putative cysteine desulfurase [Waddlia chondrophila WSU 86-1044]CCB90521.1 cysteine desulfurase [Waddlia chondrophila 2032/99]